MLALFAAGLLKKSNILYDERQLYTVYSTPEYEDWLSGQSAKTQVQVRGRLVHVRDDGHFGDHRDLGKDLWELRWKNGRRVYYAYLREMKILLLLGGNKIGQDKDIRQARSIYGKHTSAQSGSEGHLTQKHRRKRD